MAWGSGRSAASKGFDVRVRSPYSPWMFFSRTSHS